MVVSKTRSKTRSNSKLDKEHFDRCLKHIIHFFAKNYHYKGSIPSSAEFLSFYATISKDLSTSGKGTNKNNTMFMGLMDVVDVVERTDDDNIKRGKNTKTRKISKKHFTSLSKSNKSADIRQPQPQRQRQQSGGLFGYDLSFRKVFEYLKPIIGGILGVMDDNEYGKCAYFETSLNLLVWAAYIYCVTVGSGSGSGGEQLLIVNQTTKQIMTHLSAPNDYILSFIPGLNTRMHELTFGKLTEYIIRINNDYQTLYQEPEMAANSVLIITKLLTNSKTYLLLYITPIICLMATLWKECEKRCNVLKLQAKPFKPLRTTSKSRKSRKSRKSKTT